MKITWKGVKRASQAESSHDESDDDVSVSKIVDHFMQISEDFVISQSLEASKAEQAVVLQHIPMTACTERPISCISRPMKGIVS